MKSYQFFKIYKRFHKKRKKTVIQQSMRKEKTEESWIPFYLNGYLMKPLKMAINHFFFNISFCSQDFFFFYFSSSFTAQFLFFDVRMAQEISKGETGNDK